MTGYAQHGKDTFAAELVNDHGFTRFAFAETLKDMMYTLTPMVPVMDTAGDIQEYVGLADLVDELGWDEAKVSNPEVRRLLQVFGTEVMREQYGTDVWVDIVARKAEGEEAVVVTDCRFPNEFAWVKEHGLLVKVSRVNPDGTPFDNGLGTDHPSERYIATAPADYEFEFQTGDLISIREAALQIAAHGAVTKVEAQ
jgi:hypothetical protein